MEKKYFSIGMVIKTGLCYTEQKTPLKLLWFQY